ncbi:non-homologous end joining protein Ku [Devosia pacifica]|uniref:Non-homologous end joining protein Ku n=1 Tax=Devosia pacifica TaxID=1335967 RepID=A0A918S6L2_9HYPH|nr:Ku protein [Devosia pacifica]GHA26914.1 non-homologous end joining protein Ku [Devosia pacifica]
MASRPIWKGQLRLSLVSIPVALYSATKSSAKPSFRQIHEPSGKPIHYEKVVEGVGPVDRDEIIKGYEYQKGDYVLLDDDELDAVKLETKQTLELTQFVGACEIDPIYFDKPYFVVPSDELAEDAFRVVRDALRKTEKVGLGQLALRGKEYLVAIKPTGTGLMLETLHYEEEIRKADPFFSEISNKKSEDDLLDVATALIEKKTAPFEADAFKNHYQAALHELIQRKLKSKGKKISTEDEAEPARPSGDNVVDLMSALKQSLEGGSASKPSAKSRTTNSKSKTSDSKGSSGAKPSARTKTSKSSSSTKKSSSAGKSSSTSKSSSTRKKAS